MRRIAPFLIAAGMVAGQTKIDYISQVKNQPYLLSDNNSAYTTVAQACTAATAKGLILSVGRSWTAMTTQSIACDLQFEKGGMLQPASGQTVTLTHSVTAPPIQIFDISAGGTVIFSPRAPLAYTEWWGALADNSTNNSSALQAAINAVQGAVAGDAVDKSGKLQLLPGIYRHATALTAVLGGIEIAGAGMKSSILRCTACTSASQLTTFTYSYIHDLGFDNLGTATNALEFSDAHNTAERIWAEPTVGYSDAILHSTSHNNQGLHDNYWRDIHFPGGTTKSGASLSIDCGVNFSGRDLYMFDGLRTAIEIGANDGRCGGTAVQFTGNNVYVALTSSSPGGKGFWVKNGSTVSLDGFFSEMCGDNSAVCGSQPGLQFDSLVSGSVRNSVFDGGGGGGEFSGYVAVTSTNVRNLQFTNNEAAAGINTPTSSCLVYVTGSTGLHVADNNIGSQVTYDMCGPGATPAYVNVLGGAGSSASVDLHSTPENVRVSVTIGTSFAAAGGFGYLDYATLPFSSTASKSPFCSITSATAATAQALVTRGSLLYFDNADTTTTRVYLGVSNAGLAAGDYQFVVNCPIR